MPTLITRRPLLRAAAAALASGGVFGFRTATGAAGQTTSQRASAPTDAGRRILKGLHFSMLPEKLSVKQRFRLAAEAGFDGIECSTVFDESQVAVLRDAADESGVRIHSILDGSYPDSPLTSESDEIAGRGMHIVRQSLRNAKALGADTVLLIPAKVTPQVRYAQAYERSQQRIRQLLPLAHELGVTLAIENVGNRFLLSPLEFARYVDEFKDPLVRAYLDIGNCLVLWSYPQDWILTLGRRIHRVHVKDWDPTRRRFVLPGQGEVDWPVVRQALAGVGYSGFATAELPGGDGEYLKGLAVRMDRVLGLLPASSPANTPDRRARG